MKIIYAFGYIIIGILVLRMTIRDEKKYKSILSSGYSLHLGGYIGGIGAIIVGLTLLYEVISGNHFFN
jgi:hypothetical protein